MTEIIYKGQVYAIYDSIDNIETENYVNKENTQWYGDSIKAIQASKMCYNIHKTFRPHKHILRPRLNNYTQECFIVYKGLIKIDIYDEHGTYIKKLLVGEGDIAILYKGYHGLEVLEDNSVFFEIKNGPFTTVEEDKIYL